jgi:hypothetical protein
MRLRIHFCLLGSLLSCVVKWAARIACGILSASHFNDIFTAAATRGSLGSFAVPLGDILIVDWRY